MTETQISENDFAALVSARCNFERAMREKEGADARASEANSRYAALNDQLVAAMRGDESKEIFGTVDGELWRLTPDGALSRVAAFNIKR